MKNFIKKSLQVIGIATVLHMVFPFSSHSVPAIQLKQDKLSKITPISSEEYDAKQSIVRIYTEDRRPICSGTIISNEYVLTAAHCLFNEHYLMKDIKYLIVTQNYDRRLAEPVGLNVRLDTGLLKGHFDDLSKGMMNTTEALQTILNRAFDSVASFSVNPNLIVTCGYPQLQKELVCSPISSVPKLSGDTIVVTGQLSPGMSGGPVMVAINGNYEIFAVNTSVHDLGEVDDRSNIDVSPILGLLGTYGIDPWDTL